MTTERKVTVIEPIAVRLEADKTIPTQKLRVAAYARVSTEQDEQQSSYEAQLDYYTRYITSNPEWELAGIFSDEGISGTNTKKRDGFNQMVQKALDGEIDLILTKSISRFARNTVDTLQTVRELKTAGVEVRFEKENLHTMDPKCEMMLTIMSSLAQEESRSISENVRWGQRRSMEEGNVHLAYSRFLGYCKGEDGRPKIVEEEAVIIREIYQLFLDGYTINNIANQLTERGIPTPAGKSKWPVSTVKSILTNEKYRGDALLQKSYTVDYLTKEVRKNNGEVKQYLVENSHDPIIDPETFDLVQQRMATFSATRKHNHSSGPYANCLICGDCGNCYGHKVWRHKDVWYCNHRYENQQRCQTPTLAEEDLRTAFETALRITGKGAGSYSDDLWRKFVESATVTQDSRVNFRFRDGTETIVSLQQK